MLICLYWQPALHQAVGLIKWLLFPTQLFLLPFLIDNFWICQVSQGICLPLIADGCLHVGRLGALPPTPTSRCFQFDGHFCTGGIGNLCILKYGCSYSSSNGNVYAFSHACSVFTALTAILLLKGGITPSLGWAYPRWNTEEIHIERNNKQCTDHKYTCTTEMSIFLLCLDWGPLHMQGGCIFTRKMGGLPGRRDI